MASKYLQKYQVPEGFYDILHEFSREILRAQPEDILDYAANYFEHKCQGKEYYYESKANVQRTNDESKKYAPTPAANFAGQAQRVVAVSNQIEKTAGAVETNSNVNRQPSSNSVKPQSQNRIPSGGASRPRTQNSIKSDLSHPDEKRMTKEFVGDVFNSALSKVKPSSADRSDDGEGQSKNSFNNEEKEESVREQKSRGSNRGIQSQQSNKLSAQEIAIDTPGEGDDNGMQQGEQEDNHDGQQQEEKQFESAEGPEPSNNEEQGEGQEVVLKQRGVQEEQVVLDGPVEEYENVALKIQSVFRGSQVRKATKKQ